MTLSIGPATDYLFALAVSACSDVSVDGEPMVASDGGPVELTDGMFVVGLSEPPPTGQGSTSNSVARRTLGSYFVSQDYTIPCCIQVILPGTSQKAPRDIAESVFNTFWLGVADDPTLGGVLDASGQAQVTQVTETPLNVGTVGEPGRLCLLSFGVNVTSLTSVI